MSKTLVPPLILPLILAATAAHAQQAPAPDAAADSDADTIVVTATRVPTPVDAVPDSVTVLDKAAIDKSQDIGVTELLLRTPGVSISRNGGYGTATSLRIRGAESGQTVVVIDGVKLNDPSATDAGYNFANLLVGDASRIEVLRGPQSILWGSQAIGGVVNIVTPLPEKSFEASADLEGGARKTFDGRAAIGAKSGPVQWRVAGYGFTTAGISAIAPEFGGHEADGYRNYGASGRALIALADGVSADLRGYYSNGRTEIDGFSGDTDEYSLTREFVGYAGLNVALFGGRLRNRFGYGYTNTDRDNFNPDLERTQTFDASGRNERFEYQGSFAVARGWNLQFGAEHEESRFRSVSPPAALADPVPDPARGKTEITSGYAQLSAQPIRGLTLTGGLRHDDHDRYGGKTLFSAGGVYALPTGTILRADYGEGFKAPSLYQLFSEYGNAALDPEQAHGWEAGVEQHLFGDALQFGATYWERTSTDQIIFASCLPDTTDPLCTTPGTGDPRFGYYANVARAEAHGIEAQASARIGAHVTLDGNYSRTIAVDRSPGASTFGKWLPRRPRDTGNASATYAWGNGATTGVAVRWAGKSFDNAANTTLLRGYALVDLRGELPVTSQVRLFARAENLFDQHYMTAYRYNSLGRSIYFGVRGRF